MGHAFGYGARCTFLPASPHASSRHLLLGTRPRAEGSFAILNSLGRVLCVEDEADILELLCCLLEAHGFEALGAATCADALRFAAAERFDLFLLDCMLPDGDGTELCRRLRLLAPHAPVVFLSGMAEPAGCERGMEAGASLYLVKPADLDTLPETLARVIRDAHGG